MIDKKIDLALAFLERKPSAAARTLEQQPMEEVACFLNELPCACASPMLAQMLPQYAARIFLQLDPKLCAGFLDEMEVSQIAAILRYSKQNVRNKILSFISEKSKIACKLLLNYSEDSVGAWMTTQVAALPDCSVDDALKRLTTEEISIDVSTLYVIDSERHLQGSISAADLLRADLNAPIMSVMQKKTAVLQGRSSLFSIQDHQGWKTLDTLPVLNRNHQLVGVLRHIDLRKGLEQIATTVKVHKNGDFISNICEVYGRTLLALFSSVGEMTNAKKE